MQGRLENQVKTEKIIERYLADAPKLVSDYYINFSATKEFRSCLGYIQKLRRFLSWYADEKKIELEDVDCISIEDGDISKFMKSIEIKKDKDKITYTSFSHRRQYWSVLNSFFEYLTKKNYIDSNPMQLIEYPNKKDKVTHAFLNKDDLDKLIQAVVNGLYDKGSGIAYEKRWKGRDLAIIYTFIYTGMRVSALCEIDMQNIDLENNSITVIDKEHKKNTYNIPEKLKSVYLDWIEQRELILGEKEADALFISARYKRLDRISVYNMIQKYSKEALGYSVSPHRLRAAYGNIIYNETHDIELTSRAMKHENISTTRIYMESNESAVNKKVEDILSNIF